MTHYMKYQKHSLFLFLVFSFLFFVVSVYAQTETPTPTPTDTATSGQLSEINNKIKELEKKVADLKSQENSLSSQIGAMDNQIKLTEYRINATQQEIIDITLDIDSATKRMKNLEGSLTDVSKILLNRIVATYKAGANDTVGILLASEDLENAISRANYLRIVQAHDKQLLLNTQQARNDYSNQKQIFEDKKKKIEALKTQLEGYTAQLDKDKEAKKKLLADTQGDEKSYQKLLSQARAQLAGFSRFTANQGGASLLSGQTVCDDWGCYYNQRDAQWGSNALNGTQYTLASDGCLVTSMAMVYTHFGYKGVTPQTINSNPNNFASYYPAWLKHTISADGATSSRVNSAIDSELSAGRPVVVGISYDGGPLADHFLVLISGSSGNYMMNDPYTPNGHNIPLTSHYSVGSIREIYKIVL